MHKFINLVSLHVIVHTLNHIWSLPFLMFAVFLSAVDSFSWPLVYLCLIHVM